MSDSSLILFDDFDRVDAKRDKHDSSTYRFLNNSAWPAAAYVRKLLSQWAMKFPLDKDFTRRFKSLNNRQHRSAFFELVMFEWFLKHQFEVKFQQPVVEGSSRRPDFTIVQNTERKFIAECTVSPSHDDNEGRDTLQNQITDVLESVSSPNYFVNIDFVQNGKGAIRKKIISDFIKAMLDDNVDKPTTSKGKPYSLITSGWQIDFDLIPKTNQQRTLGVTSYGGFIFIDSERPLRAALNAKRASKYGRPSIPFVICVNSTDPFLDEISTEQTFIGSSEQTDAYFLAAGKPQNTGVSAVMIVKHVGPWNLHDVKASLWHNPWAINPLPKNLLAIDQRVFESKPEEKPWRIHSKLLPGAKLGETLLIDAAQLTATRES